MDSLIRVNDSTLRDGEQAPGVAFRLDEKVKIALALEDAGVDEIEVGVPAMGGAEVQAIKAIGEVLEHATPIAWCRMTEADVDAAASTGVSHVHLTAPLSDRQIAVKRAGSQRAVLARLRRVVAYARKVGLVVSLGGEDASRADRVFIQRVVCAAEEAGVTKFRYADTLGVLDPFSTLELFHELRQHTEMDLEFHGHDDLGLATANTLAAVRGGATHVSVCVLGLGERAGNAPLEEVVAALGHVEMRGTGVRLAALPALAQLVASASNRAIPEAKAIVGTAAFSHESGIHVSGLLRDPRAYEALDPALFGRERSIVLGKHSGRAALAHVLGTLGYVASEATLGPLLELIRATATELKRPIEAHELAALFAHVEQSPKHPPS